MAGREWGSVTAAKVLAVLTGDRWQGNADVAKALGTGKVQAVAYRLKLMAADGLIVADRVPYNGGTPMNVYRLKPEVKSAAS